MPQYAWWCVMSSILPAQTYNTEKEFTLALHIEAEIDNISISNDVLPPLDAIEACIAHRLLGSKPLPIGIAHHLCTDEAFLEI